MQSDFRNTDMRRLTRRLFRYLLFTLVPTIACIILLFAVSKSPFSSISNHSNSTITQNTDEAFETFTNELFKQQVSSSTINLHYTLQNPADYGISNAPVTYGSFNTNSTLALAGLENCQAALHAYDRDSLSKDHQLTFDILESYLNTSIIGAPYTLYEEPLSPVTGMQAQLPVLLSEYHFSSSADVDTYLSLLSTTPDYFHSLIQFETEKSQNGLFMADYTVDSIIDQCNAFIAMQSNNYLISTFAERLDALNLPETDKEVYLSSNQNLVQNAVIPSYQTLISALESLKGTAKNNNGLSYLPHGKDYYSYVVMRETGSKRSISKLKDLTTKQIASDLKSMKPIIAETAATTNLDSLFTETNPSTILTNLQSGMSSGFPQPPAVSTQVKYVPADMEPYLSPAFYMIPTIDNTSDNVIYINQAHMSEGIDLYTTLAHEGYPGHLYQTTYFSNQHPAPIRSILDFGGYVEGWATYAEMCSYYFSPLSKDQATLLQKNASIILGLYSLADIGIHYEGWTLLDTVSFFRGYGITNTDTIEDIFELIISDPGNYLKYYIGYVEFMELKKEAIKEQGNHFSEETFHKAILSVGPAPFDILKDYVLHTK